MPLLVNNLTNMYHLSKKIQELNHELAKVRKQVLNEIKEKNLIHHRFKLGDKYIQYNKSVSYQPLSQKFLREQIKQFLGDTKMANELMRHILEAREESCSETISINKIK